MSKAPVKKKSPAKSASAKAVAKARKTAPAAKRAPKKPAPPSPAAQIVGQPMVLSFDSLFPSPLNPRRHHESEPLDRLADSIATFGLLQPLVARPAPDGRFEIAAGGRRHAGIGLNIARGRFPSDFGIHVMVAKMTDRQLLLVAGEENLQRRDMHPLDEAEYFDSLRKTGMTETEIASDLHIGVATVWRRLALLRCVFDVQDALLDGKITLNQAQAFALGEPLRQAEYWVGAFHNTDFGKNPEHIRKHMVGDRAPESRAAFPVERYTGEFVIDAETGERFFANHSQFMILQEEAAGERLEAMRQKYKWADRLKEGGAKAAHYILAEKTDKRRGAILWLDANGALQVREGVLKPEHLAADETARLGAKGSRTPGDGPAAPVDAVLRGEDNDAGPDNDPVRGALKDFTAAHTRFQRLLCSHPRAAMALAILFDIVQAVGDDEDADKRIAQALLPFAPALAAALGLQGDDASAESVMGILAGGDLAAEAVATIVNLLAHDTAVLLLGLWAAIHAGWLCGTCVSFHDGTLPFGRALLAACGEEPPVENTGAEETDDTFDPSAHEVAQDATARAAE